MDRPNEKVKTGLLSGVVIPLLPHELREYKGQGPEHSLSLKQSLSLMRRVSRIERDRIWEIQQMFWSEPKEDRLQKILRICWGLHETKFGQVSEVPLFPQERMVVSLAAEYMRHLCEGMSLSSPRPD
jgi:hypothetical protein